MNTGHFSRVSSLPCIILLLGLILQASSSWTRQIYRAPSLHQRFKVSQNGLRHPRRISRNPDVLSGIREEERRQQNVATTPTVRNISESETSERRVGRRRHPRAQWLRLPRSRRNFRYRQPVRRNRQLNRGNPRNRSLYTQRLQNKGKSLQNISEIGQNRQVSGHLGLSSYNILSKSRSNSREDVETQPQNQRRRQLSQSPFASYRDSFTRFISHESQPELTPSGKQRLQEQTEPKANDSTLASNRKADNQRSRRRQTIVETQRNDHIDDDGNVTAKQQKPRQRWYPNSPRRLPMQPFASRSLISMTKSHFLAANSISNKHRGKKSKNQRGFSIQNKNSVKKQNGKQNEPVNIRGKSLSEIQMSRKDRKRQILQYLGKVIDTKKKRYQRGNSNNRSKNSISQRKDRTKELFKQNQQKQQRKEKLNFEKIEQKSERIIHQNNKHRQKSNQRHQLELQKQIEPQSIQKLTKQNQNKKLKENEGNQAEQPKKLSELVLALQPGEYYPSFEEMPLSGPDDSEPQRPSRHIPQAETPHGTAPPGESPQMPKSKNPWQDHSPGPALDNIPGLASPGTRTRRRQTRRNWTPRSRPPRRNVWRHQAPRNSGQGSILPECDPDTCQPPDCTCASYKHPGNFAVTRVPMMVMLTFDDTVTSLNFPYFQQIMNMGLRNPNGCPIKMTFFVCDDGNNDYSLTRQLYLHGHEIASHSQTHRFPESWWAGDADEEDYQQEFVGQRQKLSELAGIPEWEIKGLRTPFLSINGDNMMNVARDYDFDYDSSCVSTHPVGYGRGALWPYTLDYPPNSVMCEQETRPTEPFPGIWEVPLTKYSCDDRDESSRGNYMLDECRGRIGNNATDVANFLWRHFNHHYATRAPMGVFTHATFFRDQPGALSGFLAFLQGLTKMQDVWIVSVSQMLKWMKDPTPLDRVSSLDTWNC